MFDKSASQKAFESTLYPLLRENCAYCHSTETHAQAPIHSDVDPALAHAYALTRVNFRKPEDSKFVVRMMIDRHNCFGSSCRDAGMQMLSAVQAWADAVRPLLPETPRPVAEGEMVAETQVTQWIADDRAALDSADAEFTKYVSLHELHNAGASADDLNIARVALSKALNSTARWAPAIVNPVDINGKGIVYRFDMRDYWGHNKGVTKLHFGGSDDDLFFGSNKTDVEGNPVDSSVLNQRYDFSAQVSDDPSFAQLVWKRVLYGNVEGAVRAVRSPRTSTASRPTTSRPASSCTRSRAPTCTTRSWPSRGTRTSSKTSSAWCATPAWTRTSTWSRSKRSRSTRACSTVRAPRPAASTGRPSTSFTGQNDTADPSKMRFPFWAHPIPKFISGTGGAVRGDSLSFIATLAQPLKTQIDGNADLTAQCEPQTNYGGADTFYNCRYYTGQDGLQQSAKDQSGTCRTVCKVTRCSAASISAASTRSSTSFATRASCATSTTRP